MDEKNQEGNGFSADTTSTVKVNTESSSYSEVGATPEVAIETAPVAEELATAESTHNVYVESTPVTPSAFNIKAYAAAIIGILVIGAGLLFVLEKEGRISTGLFSGVITKMEANTPVAKVNDVVIPKTAYDSSYQQLVQMAGQKGADVTDPTVLAQFKTQAVETLVNAELLRQAAVNAGMTATPEGIEARFKEISDGVGGPEALTAKMVEFGVTEESLRQDIENEILIQSLFDAEVTNDSPEVTDEQIAAFYKQAGGAEAGLPPLKEIKDQIAAQVKFEQEQSVIGDYVEKLRSEADVEILI